jgi:hypothetical protein
LGGLVKEKLIEVVTYLMVIAVVGLVILMPLAGELGKRAQKAE